MGNWKGTYGTKGYIIPGYEWNYPLYGDIAILKMNQYINPEVSLSNALLQSPVSSERVNICYYSENDFIVNIVISGEKKRKVSFYFLDWTQAANILCQIEVRSLDSNKVMDVREVETKKQGVYITYELLGAYQIIIKYKEDSQGREYGDFYGVFFD